jgi:ketosteroid isomerase-like protein
MSGVVERYLDTLTRHDWDAFADTLSDDVVRVGPYGDTYTPKAEYLAFISKLMASLVDYSMEVSRITYTDGVAYAELAESMTWDGEYIRTPECLTFDLAPDGRIARIEVFIQTWPRS